MTRKRPLRHVTFALGLAITALLVATAVLSLVYTPKDPLAMSITGRLQGPSAPHPFGTDQYGRDVLARVMAGTVTSIAVGVLAVTVGAGVGVPLGVAGGYVGGLLDEVLMRLVDAVQGFPAILSALLEVLGEEYVRTARAKGVREGLVVVKHALGNALIPVVTVAGIQLGQLLAGSIILESVFALPGLGRLALGAITARDLPVVQGVTLFVASCIVTINFAVDLSYAWLDPRIRRSRA